MPAAKYCIIKFNSFKWLEVAEGDLIVAVFSLHFREKKSFQLNRNDL